MNPSKSEPFRIAEPAVGPAGRSLPTDPEALLYPAEAAHLMALSERTLEGMRVRGGGPPFCRLRRSVRYRRGDIVAWIATRRVGSTSAAESIHDGR